MLRLVLLGFLIPFLAFGQDFVPAGIQELEKAVDRALAKKQPAGAVVWLDHLGSRHVLVKGKRAVLPADEAMTEDTVFDAASLTKVVATAPAVMLLVEQGKVDLEAPVTRYLPEFTGDGREKIRIRHLLTHTSGLKAGLPRNPPWTGYDEGIRLATSTVPDGPPDTFFRYSDINFILLGEVVRRASGETLDVFTAKNLFAPLGMTSTRFNPPADWQPRIAPTEKDDNGHMLRGDVHDPTARRMGGVAGHAGLFTNAPDLAQFCLMILNGGEVEGVRILKAETLALMQKVQTAATIYDRRGLGWDLDSGYSRPRGKVFPPGSFGHTGFTGTSLWIDPHSHSFVILLTSRLHPNGGGSVRDLYEEIGTAAAHSVPNIEFSKVTGDFKFRKEKEVPSVLNGIDVLKRDGFAALADLKVGLITNQTGADAQRNVSIDLLAEAPRVKLRALFSPEHGIRGQLDQEKITDGKDRKTGRPIYSLYGDRRAPTPEQMQELDALVFDIQDIGCRFYTYISTLRLCMEAAAKAGKPVFVLDRINPVGGLAVEGPSLVDKEAFTATHAIPLRHGMTVGELAQLMNNERQIGADLRIIRVEGWRRELLFDQTGLPWISPSPNMRSLEAALLYPGIGLLEFSVSVGRGTDTPFQVVGAPYVDDLRLAYEMNKLGLPGVRFTPIRFTPTASVFKDKACGGVRMQITDREALKPVLTGIALITVLQKLHPRAFDLEKVQTLLNQSTLLDAIKKGRGPKELEALWSTELAAFNARRSTVLLY